MKYINNKFNTFRDIIRNADNLDSQKEDILKDAVEALLGDKELTNIQEVVLEEILQPMN